MNILFADDEASITEQMKKMLMSLGHNVSTVADGRAALSALRQREDYFDLLITDVQMGELDGLTLLSRITNLGINVPVVVITGHGNMDTAIDALRNGAIDFIPKPFSRKDIIRVLDRAKEINLDQHNDFADWPYVADEITFTFPAAQGIDALAAQRAMKHFQPAFRSFGVLSRPLMACVREALRNAVTHGSKEGEDVTFSMAYSGGSSPAFTIRVRDSGAGFDHERVRDEAEASLSAADIQHKSIFLMLNSMTDVQWNQDGREIVLVKSLSA